MEEIISRSNEALQVEYKLVDWIFDDQDLEFLKRQDVKDYIAKRMQDSLEAIDVHVALLTEERYIEVAELFEWFDLRIKARVNNDFFANKATSYAKGRAFTSKDAFSKKFYNILEELGVHV